MISPESNVSNASTAAVSDRLEINAIQECSCQRQLILSHLAFLASRISSLISSRVRSGKAPTSAIARMARNAFRPSLSSIATVFPNSPEISYLCKSVIYAYANTREKTLLNLVPTYHSRHRRFLLDFREQAVHQGT